ncbi:MAG: hypothetical protein HYV61_07230 [Candidatus Rokubacteria bacterium]|nr:hypothetical protein [Candidatus Rokubacteria bacterium]
MIPEAVMEEYREGFDTSLSPSLETLARRRMEYFRKVSGDTRLSTADRVLLLTHTDAVLLYSLLSFDASSKENAKKYMNAVASTVLELIDERE